jgi:hypothetical protein
LHRAEIILLIAKVINRALPHQAEVGHAAETDHDAKPSQMSQAPSDPDVEVG